MYPFTVRINPGCRLPFCSKWPVVVSWSLCCLAHRAFIYRPIYIAPFLVPNSSQLSGYGCRTIFVDEVLSRRLGRRRGMSSCSCCVCTNNIKQSCFQIPGIQWDQQTDCWIVKVGFAIQNESFLFLFFPAGDPFSKRCHIPGRWFGTCFIFHNIWDNPSHWLSYFSRWLKPTKQIRHLDPGGEEFIGTFLLVFTVECNVSVGNPTFAGRWGVGNSEVLCSPNYRGLSNRRNPPTRAV